jgi:hypothetical protein
MPYSDWPSGFMAFWRAQIPKRTAILCRYCHFLYSASTYIFEEGILADGSPDFAAQLCILDNT